MNQKPEIDYGRVWHYLWIAAALLALLAVNYCAFNKYLSSNAGLINDFTPQENDMEKSRSPAVAGLFYSAEARQLDKEVKHYLNLPAGVGNKQPRILIVPHAGYYYSAQTAAKAYVELAQYADTIHTVILLGPSHHVAFKGAALSASDSFSTPLGKIKVNKAISGELAAKPGFEYNDRAHVREHSLEVQLPFLQKVLQKFTIVPLVYGDAEPGVLAAALSPYLDNPGVLLVVSADLSHYYEAPQAEILDKNTAELVAESAPEVENHMSCGAIGINTAILLAKSLNLQPQLLDLTHSGNISGDMASVVGYASWLFSDRQNKEEPEPLTPIEQESENLEKFARRYGARLMEIARRSLETAVNEQKQLKISRQDYEDILFDKGASFVTLKSGGALRGCIGTLVPQEGIAMDVAANAYRAAMEDSRFKPVTAEELKDIEISVSLLTDFERIRFSSEEDLREQIIPGVDGLVLRDGDRQGVFLPVVWQEIPDKEEFVDSLKLKAGLSPNYWSDKIKIYRFRTVEIKQDEN